MARTTPVARPTRQLRDITAAADHLGVNPRTIRRYISEGRLTAYRVGGKLLRVDMAEVDALARPVAPHEVAAL